MKSGEDCRESNFEAIFNNKEWARLFDLEVVRRLKALESSLASLDLPSLMKMEHGGSNNLSTTEYTCRLPPLQT